MQPEFPEQGEIVLATITKLMDHGAYVSLDEYDDMQGFLHISEIAPGWIRSIAKFIRVGEKKVLLVKKVNPGRNDVDLSLKQVSADQRKRKLLEAKQYEKGNTLMNSVSEKAGLSPEDREKTEDLIYAKYDSLYDAFMDIASRSEAAAKLKVSDSVRAAILEVCEKIKIPVVEVRGTMQITCQASDGVEIIKQSLLEAIPKSRKTQTKITYLGAPKYRLTVTAPDFKTAEKTIAPITADIQRRIEKKHGTFKFDREESKKRTE